MVWDSLHRFTPRDGSNVTYEYETAAVTTDYIAVAENETTDSAGAVLSIIRNDTNADDPTYPVLREFKTPFEDQNATISNVNWSPDTSKLAVNSSRGLRMIDTSSANVGDWTVTSPGISGSTRIEWSPDSQYYASTRTFFQADGHLYVHDADTHNVVFEDPGVDDGGALYGYYQGCEWTAGGNALAVSTNIWDSNEQGTTPHPTIAVFDATNGFSLITKFETAQPDTMRLTSRHDGERLIAWSGSDGGYQYVYDTTTWTQTARHGFGVSTATGNTGGNTRGLKVDSSSVHPLDSNDVVSPGAPIVPVAITDDYTSRNDGLSVDYDSNYGGWYGWYDLYNDSFGQALQLEAYPEAYDPSGDYAIQQIGADLVVKEVDYTYDPADGAYIDCEFVDAVTGDALTDAVFAEPFDVQQSLLSPCSNGTASIFVPGGETVEEICVFAAGATGELEPYVSPPIGHADRVTLTPDTTGPVTVRVHSHDEIVESYDRDGLTIGGLL